MGKKRENLEEEQEEKTEASPKFKFKIGIIIVLMCFWLTIARGAFDAISAMITYGPIKELLLTVIIFIIATIGAVLIVKNMDKALK